MMRVANPKPAVRAFIVENLFLDADAHFGDDDSLLEAGALDSTAVMEVVEFLQENFLMKIENSEINPDNFETVNRIVAFIESKTALASAA